MSRRGPWPIQRQIPLFPKPLPPPGEAEGDACLSIGSRNPNANTRTVKVCLTPNQCERLFGNESPRKVGCGSFGCAFTTAGRPDRVIKITTDDEDAAGMEIARDARIRHVAKLHDSFQLRQGGRASDGQRKEVFALVVERVHQLPKPWQRAIGRVLKRASHQVWRSKVHGLSWPSLNEHDMAEACPRATKRDNENCKTFARELVGTIEELWSNGVEWTDIHRGNVGIGVNGEWKVIDLGYLNDHIEPRAEMLAGVKRKRGGR